MKTIIASRSLHTTIRQDLMKQTNTNYLVDVKLVTLDQFLSIEQAPLSKELLAYNRLSKLDLVHFRQMINYPSFISEVIKALRLLLQYDIDFNTLRTDSSINQELKDILTSLKDLDFKETKYQKAINNLADTYDDLYLYPSFLSPFHSSIYTTLLNKGAKLYPIKEEEPHIELYKALNQRVEVEAVAQKIINEKLNASDIQVVISNDAYKDIINQVFKRYNLPYYFISPIKRKSILASYFKLIYQFIKKPSLELLVKIIKEDVFLIDGFSDFIAYIDININDLENIYKPLNYYQNITNSNFNDVLKDAQELENKARLYHEQLLVILNELKKLTNFKEIINYIFELLNRHHQYNQLFIIKNFIETNHQLLLQTNEDYFIELISQLEYSLDNNFVDGIIVTNIKEPLMYTKHRFVLGLDQKNYPGFKSLTGYFDEEYFSDLAIPSEQERSDLHINELQWLFKNCQQLDLSYSFADYSGKGKELAYHIEKMVAFKPKLMLCNQNDRNTLRTPRLSKETASKIYLNENTMNTTVYKMEQHFTCPFRHYMKQGLKLKKSYDIYDFNRIQGIINHACIQELIENKGKDYANNKEMAQSILDKYYDELFKLFPSKLLELNLYKQQNKYLLELNLSFLSNFEVSSLYKPSALEKQFKQTINFGKYDLLINGIVDRVDYNNDYFRVIDYKSSAHKVNLDTIRQGLKLQLITYLYCEYLLDQTKLPSSILYYSFSQDNKSYQTIDKINTKKYHRLSDDELQDLYFKANKFNGLIFDDLDNQGDTNYLPTKQSKLDVSDVFDEVNNIIHLYLDDVLAGNVSIDPIKDACKYCEFSNICRFLSVGKNPQFLERISDEVE